jgi:hypothetical protein
MGSSGPAANCGAVGSDLTEARTHIPFGRFWTNGAGLVLAAVAFSLTRAAGPLVSGFHPGARTATFGAHLIGVPPV